MAKPDGYTAYRLFTAINLHFTNPKYDLLKYNGRIRCPRETYENRRDRKLFERLANRHSSERDLIQFIVANYAYDNRGLVWDLNGDSEEHYITWTKRKESISEVFREDLSKIFFHAEKNKLCLRQIFDIDEKNEYPELLKLFLSKDITIETMVILNQLTGYIEKWHPLILLWHDLFLKINRLTTFVKYDIVRIQTIYNTFIENIGDIEEYHGQVL